jgi:cobalt-zinc-cadmium efflux system outer membrane protein
MRLSFLVCCVLVLDGADLAAQQPITRAQAIEAAFSRGARAAFARADTAAAAALLHGVRLYPNPQVSAAYSKDPPHYHVLADLPLDWPWLRAPRIGAAAAARDAARYGFAFEQAAIRFDVDTTYTGALAADAHARLSRHTASDADSLLAMARLRRSVGDVSELDVRLAEVNAGQLENVALDDSLAALEALLAVQLAMGIAGESPAIVLVDSLVPPAESLPGAPGELLPVSAAAASLRSEERALTLAHRNLFAAPSLQLGFDRDDPGGQSGLLPTVGISLPLPLFNRNGGEVAQARAARARAQANLDLVRRQSGADWTRAQRVFAAAAIRLGRDRQLLASAERVAAMAVQAYTEGAVALPNVLEAQRLAREALGRYIDDVAAAQNAAAAVRLLAATVDQ